MSLYSFMNTQKQRAAHPESLSEHRLVTSYLYQLSSSEKKTDQSQPLNMNNEETTTNLSQRPMGQNEKLTKALAKHSSEKIEIRRQKLELRRMKQEQKILFADLSSITDPACRAYIESQRAEILSKRPPSNQYGGHGERDPTQGEQIQGDHIQGEQNQREDQISPSDQQDYTPYYHYLSRNGNPDY
ncbi:hypothetical protein EUTSA_v10002965mg [Eutrema salsugineum]|uniref:No apical meristem-associated C-terminal domain-containing protein n=1 Tax=Eutrema salsugineum TaxID=72664 RepID=V4MXH3_EUTSA|nr:hypothetical protein EUTSA_v10002965mg [Eutrema salsugineum]